MDKLIPIVRWIEETYGELHPTATSRHFAGTEVYETRWSGERQHHELLGQIPEGMTIIDLSGFGFGEGDDPEFIGPDEVVAQVMTTLNQISALKQQVRRFIDEA